MFDDVGHVPLAPRFVPLIFTHLLPLHKGEVYFPAWLWVGGGHTASGDEGREHVLILLLIPILTLTLTKICILFSEEYVCL